MSEGRINDSAYAGRPSVCRNCGALVGAGESVCGMCGMPVGGFAGTPEDGAATGGRRPARDAEALGFIRAVISRPATFTFVILISNLFIFLLMTLWGPGGSENNEILRAFGAKYNSLINAGQWWRLVTPVFLHIGWIHILVNMYSLFMLGPYVEKLYGSAKFVVFWIVTGAAGVAGSYFASMYDMHEGFLGRFLFRGGDGPSAGASGALFGLVGVLFVFGIKFRKELPEEFKRAFGVGMLPTILINLFIGYTIPFIDNAAHLGGFLAGVVVALFVHYKRPGQSAGVAVFWHVLQVAALALVAAGFLMVWRNFDGPQMQLERGNVSLPNLLPGAASKQFISFAEATRGGAEAFVRVVNEGETGGVDAASAALDKAPRLDDDSNALKNELKTLLARARENAARQSTSDRSRRRQQQQRSKLIEDFDAWQKRLNEWLVSNGEKYGFKVEPRATPDAATNEPDAK